MYQQDKIQNLNFGKAVFKKMSRINEIINQQTNIQQTLSQQEWYIMHGDYQKYNWQELFLSMIECSAQVINLGQNNRFQILSQIKHVQFNNLQYLFLHSNKISNIQPLSFMNFQFLKSLLLSSNKISQIKCMNSLSAPSLIDIFICQNPLYQINALTKSKINSKQLQQLTLQYFRQLDVIHQDLSILVKLNSELTSLLQINSIKRIPQDKVQTMLKQKRFPSIIIGK